MSTPVIVPGGGPAAVVVVSPAGSAAPIIVTGPDAPDPVLVYEPVTPTFPVITLPGLAPTSAKAYSLVAASSWSVAHPFPYPPAVRLVDLVGEACDIGVDYPDEHTVAISFPVPFTGTVILS